MGHGTIDGMPSMGTFIRILTRIYASFRENHPYTLENWSHSKMCVDEHKLAFNACEITSKTIFVYFLSKSSQRYALAPNNFLSALPLLVSTSKLTLTLIWTHYVEEIEGIAKTVIHSFKTIKFQSSFLPMHLAIHDNNNNNSKHDNEASQISDFKKD